MRGSLATEQGEDEGGGGFPPPTVGSFFIFRLENVQSGAYLRRKFRLDDMYYIIITCMELKISHGIIEGEGLEGGSSHDRQLLQLFSLKWGQSGAYCSKRNEPKHLGAQFARELSDRAGGGWEGVPPSHGRELFHFST